MMGDLFFMSNHQNATGLEIGQALSKWYNVYYLDLEPTRTATMEQWRYELADPDIEGVEQEMLKRLTLHKVRLGFGKDFVYLDGFRGSYSFHMEYLKMASVTEYDHGIAFTFRLTTKERIFLVMKKRRKSVVLKPHESARI